MSHSLLGEHCQCGRCERDRYEAKAVSVIVILLAAMCLGLLVVIGAWP